MTLSRCCKLFAEGCVIVGTKSRCLQGCLALCQRPTWPCQHLLFLRAEEYKRLKTLIVGGKTGAMKNLPRNMQKGMAGMNPHDMKNQLAQMSKIIPPHVLKQMGGTAGLQGFMKQMEGKM